MIASLINKCKNENGSGLVLALMVLLVISVLGSALGIIIVGSHKLSDINRDSTSAYYIAEAGANMAYEDMERQVREAYKKSSTNELSYFTELENYANSKNGVKGLDGTIYTNFESNNGKNVFAEIEVIGPLKNDKIEPVEYIIKSTGVVNGKKRTVDKNMDIKWKNLSPIVNEEGLSSIPSDAAILVKDGLHYNNGSVIGNIYIDSNGKSSFKIDQNDFKGIKGNNIFTEYPGNAEDIFALPSWSSLLGNNDFIQNVVNKIQQKEISTNWNQIDNYIKEIVTQFDSIEKYNELPLTANEIVIDKNYKASKLIFGEHWNYDVKSIKVPDGEEFFLLVDKLIHSGNNNNIYFNGSGILNIIVTNTVEFKGGSFNINGNGNVRIFYIGPNTEFKISNNSKIKAQIIAPKSIVKLDNGSQIEGSIIANKIEIKNNSTIKFNKFQFKTNIDSTNSEQVPIGDLISSQPAIEK